MISSALAFEMGSAPIPSIASSFHLRAYHAPRLVAVSASELSPSAPAPPLKACPPKEGALRGSILVGTRERCRDRLRTNRERRHPERLLIWPVRDEVRQLELFM